MEIIDGCVGCGICVLMCTHHFSKVFQPSRSSLELKKTDTGFGLDLHLHGEDDRFVCDFCYECVRYCSAFKAKDGLRKFIEGNELRREKEDGVI